MTTILIWLGSGFSFAVGVCFGAWMMRSTFGKPDPELRANSLLEERNMIGFRECCVLERIASTLEDFVGLENDEPDEDMEDDAE